MNMHFVRANADLFTKTIVKVTYGNRSDMARAFYLVD